MLGAVSQGSGVAGISDAIFQNVTLITNAYMEEPVAIIP